MEKLTSITYLKEASQKISEAEVLKRVEELIKKDIPSVQLNDLTGILVVADTIVDVINFLFGGGQALKDLISYLQKQLDHLANLLNQVMEMLVQLSVLVVEQFRIRAIYELKSVINTILDLYSEWALDPVKHQGAMTATLLSIKEKVSVAIDYGYAHHDCIALAMAQEYTVSTVLGYNKTTINNSLNRYLSYFQRVVNYSIEGSIAYRKKEIADRILQYEAAWIAREVFCGVDYTQKGRCRHEFEVWLKVTGDLLNGFNFAVWTRYNGNVECEPKEGGPGHFTLQTQKADPYANQRIWEQKHVEYLAFIKDFKTLDDSMKSCMRYIDNTVKLTKV